MSKTMSYKELAERGLLPKDEPRYETTRRLKQKHLMLDRANRKTMALLNEAMRRNGIL